MNAHLMKSADFKLYPPLNDLIRNKCFNSLRLRLFDQKAITFSSISTNFETNLLIFFDSFPCKRDPPL